MLKIFIYIILFCVFVFAYARYIEMRSIFYPMKAIEATPKDIGLDYEDIYFKVEDGVTLNGWLVKNPKAKATILVFHGNAGNISHRLEKISILNQIGLNVFIIDYRGYGRSQGRPSEEGIYKDARAAYDYLATLKGINKDKIVSFGSSIGGAVAIDLAVNRDVACLVVDSSLTSAKDMGKRFYPYIPSFLFQTKFNSIDKVKTIKSAKIFIHSINDEIVPFEFGQRLYDAASQPKEFFKILGGHNSGFMESKDVIIKKLGSYFRELGLI
ncbi:MAG: alpha/beta hydrolase [Candidatus Omnitrophota bacterium]